MASITGPVYVNAPNPVIPRYGLFNVATGPLDLPINARVGGLQYETGTCSLPLPYEVRCQTDHATKTFNQAVTTVTGGPFVVYSSIECGSVGLANIEDRVKQLLFAQLVAGEQATVEHAFSTASVGINLGLANSNAVNLGTAQGPVQATAMLEEWLYARYGLPGVLHVPMRAAEYVRGAHLTERDTPNAAWRTGVGTAVSFGNYAGTGPTGQVPGANQTWMYITGQVAIWRTPDNDLLIPPLGQVLNRATNTVDIVMEREYVITYDCYVAAVLVTLNTTDV